MVCGVLNKLNKIRLSPIWVSVVAIAAPLGLSLPATGKTAASSAGSEPVSPQEKATVSNTVGAYNGASLQNAVVEPLHIHSKAFASPEVLGQTTTTPAPTTTPETPQPTAPSTDNQGAPQQDTPDQIQVPISPSTPSNNNNNLAPNTPNRTPSPPIIRTPGNQGAPQQETPNRIQVPVTPSTPGGVTPPTNLPTAPPSTPPIPGNTQPSAAPALPEPRVLAAEVVVTTPQGGPLSADLQNQVYGAIRTTPGRTTTRTQLQEDINAIFATGYFADVRAVPEDTPLGVRVSFIVQPNPVLQSVQVQANVGTGVPSVLPPRVINEIFREQYGSILNFRRFQEGIQRLNKWYQDNGYVLAQVVASPQVSPDGNVTLQVAEGVVEDIQVGYINKEGDTTDNKGRPIRGRTRSFIVKRELELRPNAVFNRNTVQRDLARVYGLGIFEDVRVSLNPGQDPRKVVVVVNVAEKNTGSVVAGAGYSSASGLFGSLSYQQSNLGGNDQTLGGEIQVGQRELLLDANFTDPWIAGDPFRTSYTVNLFRRRTTSLIFEGGPRDVNLPNGDTPKVVRLGAGVNFTRPLGGNPLKKSDWTASAGVQYQRVSIRDDDGNISPRDQFGNQLSYSGTGEDDLFTLQLAAVLDRRNDPLRPTSGSFLRFGVEQTVPIGLGNILFDRVRASYSQYVPVRFINFSKGPQALAFNVQAGTIVGDLPPYEAFSLGGSNSVRGYDEGDVGSGRSFVQATAEYRFPLFSIVGGALFFDAATDLGTGSSVPGNPAGVRDKPGSGFGYGVGIRVQSPLGPLRLDYGFNDQGDSRFNFGIGERF